MTLYNPNLNITFASVRLHRETIIASYFKHQVRGITLRSVSLPWFIHLIAIRGQHRLRRNDLLLNLCLRKGGLLVGRVDERMTTL